MLLKHDEFAPGQTVMRIDINTKRMAVK
ncbi:hypothetical protein DERF_013231 [Dermatophagoides farinae]|uniref:Uncharacterized protein n=1 Tax=Dermatophagoides farinae TaxID=6954 RepID=A0A922HLN3_DERFA|nr:hypothetical protein DERF_013231 [Dermatophagoides farinae]